MWDVFQGKFLYDLSTGNTVAVQLEFVPSTQMLIAHVDSIYVSSRHSPFNSQFKEETLKVKGTEYSWPEDCKHEPEYFDQVTHVLCSLSFARYGSSETAELSSIDSK